MRLHRRVPSACYNLYGSSAENVQTQYFAKGQNIVFAHFSQMSQPIFPFLATGIIYSPPSKAYDSHPIKIKI